VTTRRSYLCTSELTVDYGPSYIRDYDSGRHRSARPSCSKPVELSAEQIRNACWPALPGWFNPWQQPMRRPAFAINGSKIMLCPDNSTLVRERRLALACPYLRSDHLHAQCFGSNFASLTDEALRCATANQLKRPLASMADEEDSGSGATGSHLGEPYGINEGADTALSQSNFQWSVLNWSGWTSGDAELAAFQRVGKWPDGKPLGRGHGQPYLQPQYAHAIRCKQKKVEGRPGTGWAANVKPNDWITFKVTASGGKKLVCRATRVRRFATFEAMVVTED